MKILFTRFPLESAFGGAEVQTLTLMEGLIARGHSVAFAGSCPVLLEECRKRNIMAVEWHIGPPPVTKWGVISFAWRRAAMKRKLALLLDQFHDLGAIAMLSLSEKLLLTDIAAEKGIKTVWIEHDTVGRWLTQNPWLAQLIERSRNATTVGVSEMSKKLYVEMGWDENKVIAIPNGISDEGVGRRASDSHTSEPASHAPLPNPNPNPLHLLCVARLSPEKGVDVLLSAIEDAKDISLDIIGDGRSSSELQALAKPLGGRVRFLGRRNDVRSSYKDYDALVLPSTEHDPFGLVAAEAMMAGIPVVVTDACGIADYLTNGNDALVARADNADSLKRAIGLLAEKETRDRIAREGKKTAEEKFSAKKMVSAYESLFTEGSRPHGL